MKLHIKITSIVFIIGASLNAQVGIGTENPRSEVGLDVNGITNVSHRILLKGGALNTNQPGDEGEDKEIIVSSGPTNPTAWVKKTIPDGFGESFNLTYMNSYFDTTGVDLITINQDAYSFDQAITNDWKVLSGLDNSFTVYKSSNKTNLIFQTTGQITGNASSASASFACGIFMKQQAEATYRLKGVRTDAVRGTTGSNKIINMNVTLENLPIPGGAGGTVYNVRVACFGRNVQTTFAVGKALNTTFLNQEMAQSSLKISVLESW